MTEDFTRPAGDPRTLGQDPAGPAPVGPPVTPPPPAGAPTPVSTGPVEESGSQGGTGDKAKQEAANVASNAKEQASEVAGSAKEQASEVAGNAKEQAAKVAGTAKEETQRTVGEAKRQAQDLLRQSQSELSSQAGVQQQRLAETLRSFSGELGQMADSSEEPGLATQVARWASQVSDDAGRWLEDRDPSSVFDEVRRYAGRSPGTFMLIAAGLGLAVGRVARSLKDSDDDDTTGGTGTTGGYGTGSAGGTGYGTGSPAPLVTEAPQTSGTGTYGTGRPTPGVETPGYTYGTGNVPGDAR